MIIEINKECDVTRNTSVNCEIMALGFYRERRNKTRVDAARNSHDAANLLQSAWNWNNGTPSTAKYSSKVNANDR
jgi:hypothetical protein